MINERLRPDLDVVELGAGTGKFNRHEIRGSVRSLVGIDLTPRVRDNDLIDEAVLGDLTNPPFADNSFDLAFSVYVLEHIDDASRFCQETARILRPGGELFAVTPNLYHYVTTISRFSPHWVHEWSGRQRGHTEDDMIPTRYLLNTRSRLYRHLDEAGFSKVECHMYETAPNYLTFNQATFLLGAGYERLVNSTSKLAWARVNILVHAVK